MRKIIVLLLTLGLLLVAPTGAAVAEDVHVPIVVHTESWLLDAADDGSVLYYGGSYVVETLDGEFLEDGATFSVVYPAQGGQNVTGTVEYHSNDGNYVFTKVAAHLVGFENGYAVYRGAETIVSASEGFTGRGTGTVYVYDGGAHTVSTVYFNLRPA